MLGYGLTFIGRDVANRLYSAPTNTELEEIKEKSLDRESTENSIYVGDNLEVLKHLKNGYQNKIKMIYIDPPYNTKNNHFIYPDNFKKEFERILQEEGIDKSEVKNQKGAIAHSGWLSFMYPRLRLARDLLRDDGVIFISIDDNEQANLKILCDEIFGEHNFVANIVWQKKSGGGQDTSFFAREHEYILVYKKSSWEIIELTKKQDESDFPKIINGRKAQIMKLEKWGIGALREDAPSLYYPIKDPNNEDFYPLAPNGKDGRWRKKPENLDSKHIHWQKNSKGRLTPYEVLYFDELKEQDKIIKTRTIWTEYGNTTQATKEITSIFGYKLFDTPKPTKLIKHLAQISTNDDDIVMDFFAGSGTTAHAVMELNAEDRNNGKQGNRKFILVQLDEAIDEKANKVAYDFCKSLGSENPTIADITIERVKRAGEKIREKCGDSTIDTGFKVFLCK